jgi:ubiquinone/menaquinone biosynthesis C-methylase UbiE
MAATVERREIPEEEQPRNRINLNPFTRLFESSQDHFESYVGSGQVAADLGCGGGYYTLALAKSVGPEGRVYAVDHDENAIRTLKKKADEGGYRNIEAHASSAADLSFIEDRSVDFVLANGLLCNMPDHREGVVKEIKRILKPDRRAYLSLGVPPPLGHVDRAEWESILQGFKVERRGGSIQKWAVVRV